MQVNADEVAFLRDRVGAHLHFHVLHLRAPPRPSFAFPSSSLPKRVPPGICPILNSHPVWLIPSSRPGWVTTAETCATYLDAWGAVRVRLLQQVIRVQPAR